MGTDDKLLLPEISISGHCYIVFISTVAYGSINIAIQNHRNTRIGEKIRDGFKCSSKWGFAHPEPKKRMGPSLQNTEFFSALRALDWPKN